MQSNSRPLTGKSFPLKYGSLGAASFLGLYAAWLLLGARSQGERLVVGNLALFFVAAAACALAFWARHTARHNARGTAMQRSWLLLGAGLGCLAAANLARTGLDVAYGSEVTQGTLANWLSLAAYPLLLAGLIFYPRRLRQTSGNLRLLMEITITSAVLLTLGWLILVAPVTNSAHFNGNTFWAMVYPLGDLTLLLFVLDAFLLTDPNSSSPPLALLFLGWLAFLLSDLGLSTLASYNIYQVGSPIDLGWAIGYCLIGLGGLYQANHPEDPALAAAREDKGEAAPINARQRVQSNLPLLLTFILAIYSLISWQIVGQGDSLGLWMTLVLGLVLIARQGVIAGEIEQQQYASLVNSVAEPTFVCDARGRLKLVNPALLQAAGYAQIQDLIDRPMQMLFAPEELPHAVVQLSLNQGWSGEVHLYRKDGAALPVYLSLRPILRRMSERPALAGTAHDLSQQKRQQAALKEAYEQVAAAHRELETLNEQLEIKVLEKTQNLSQAYLQLEEQNRTLQKLDEVRTDFVSLVSHELRAPLTNISGGIELMLGSPQPLPERLRESLQLVQAETRRLDNFVAAILDISALDAGRVPFYSIPLSLGTVAAAVQRQFGPLASAGRLHWKIPTDLPFVLADEHALPSVFFHLIDNALKYAPEGEIEVSAFPAGELVVAEIDDEGPGIPPDALSLVFDRFYRLHNGDAQTVYGHGLGLYIVRRLLQAMGGDIRAENRPFGGARFTFWLNAVQEKDE